MNNKKHELNRREFFAKTMPICGLACLGLGNISALSALDNQDQSPEQKHNFDTDWDKVLTHKERITMEYKNLIQFLKILKSKMDREKLIEYLKTYSKEVGLKAGTQHLAITKNKSFKSFVDVFRPPNYKNLLTHEIVQDTDTVFELKVTECIWATVFTQAGLGGDIGHAAICNMDYHWPKAYNSDLKMERSKTLMQGDEYCNHKYIDS